MKRIATFTFAAGLMLVTGNGVAAAAPVNSHSPNLEGPFPVVCNGVSYDLIDAPAGERADFTPAFVTGTNKVVIPYSFDATQTAVALTDGTVIDGVTYNAGDTIFSGSDSSSIGTARSGGRTCTFGGSDVESFPDDNGKIVEVAFTFEGTAIAMFPNSH